MTRLETLLQEFLEEAAQPGKTRGTSPSAFTARYADKIRKAILEDLAEAAAPPEGERLDELEETVYDLLSRTNVAGNTTEELVSAARQCASDIRVIVFYEAEKQ